VEPPGDDPKAMSILEKQRASYRGQLEKAAKAAAEEFVEKQRLERRPAIAKRPASKEKQKQNSRKKQAKRHQEETITAESSRPEKRPEARVSEEEMVAAESSRPERRPAGRASQEEMGAAESSRPERRPWSAVKKVLGQNQSYLLAFLEANGS